ncbi:MAG: TIGR03619 family F420-dependent LLM class oxidoreductase [Ktedonobacteraceae bacterium]
MELGVGLPTSAPYASAESIIRIAQEAERLGYNSLWTYERLLYPIAGITQPDGSTWQLPESYKSVYEPIETLSYVAARTQRVKLGTSIVNAPFQSPVLLARRFATLDRLSNGRAIAGLGQGWMEQEFATSNVSIKERGKRIEEYIEALRAIWGPDPVSYEGSFYHIPASLINPKPVQKGGIPILMGFNTPAAIKRAARLADILNPIASTFEALESAVTTFLSAAQEVGRDPSTLKVIVRANVPITATPLPAGKRPFLGGSPEQIAQDLTRVQKLKVDEVFFSDQASPTVDEAIQRLEEIQTAVRR